MYYIHVQISRITSSVTGRFDGKVGLWAFVTKEKAKRTSVNRVARTSVIKPMTNVNAQYYQDWMFKYGEVLDKTKEKMPWLKGKPVIIQHDGAKPLTAAENQRIFDNYIDADGWVFQWVTQPPQWPDLNKNDLCFFASLQRHAELLKLERRDVASLVHNVKKAFRYYSPETLERIHADLFEIYRSILLSRGDNDYKLPHSLLWSN
jgi:hypothetical protein